ncbi:MAG: DEAD/DEAH box helicase [Acidimicrobiales bacterium]
MTNLLGQLRAATLRAANPRAANPRAANPRTANLRTGGGTGEDSTADAVLEAFTAWAGERGLHLYPAQEEALLSVLAGEHVIVATPTGSGKSLVALGAHLGTLAAGRRSWYSAPIKALVSEKFFDLCGELGTANVGMLTGDASINPDAPVICCTAEVLANLALREGEGAPVDQVVMDEFHFYADPDRGWAWQVPLIELPRAQFVLMSATLGDVSRFVADLDRRTGRHTTVVASAQRPVPLDYHYARTLVHDTINELVAGGLAPVYAVHFTQKSAVERAQALTSAGISSRAEREEIARAIAGFRFGRGFGQALSRLVHHGVGVHHAGMLPKYRRLVERLCQQGLLKVVCGTDTLGVGINVPIRTVLFTALSKYDGNVSRLLSAREFHQMAGRAGRAGWDSAGSVVVQAPEHVAENAKAAARAGNDPARLRKLVKAKPPKGFVNWDEGTFNRLVSSPPEPLVSSFRVTNAMLLQVLDRPGDGCAAMKRLLIDNDEAKPAMRRHIRAAIALYRSLLASGVLERLDEPDEKGRRVRVTVDLQEDFALNQPLSLLVLEALPRLVPGSPDWEMDVVSVVESTLEDPRPVLVAQLERRRAETLARLKEEGVEYEDRMEVLRELEHPKPLAGLLYEVFDTYRVRHPWAADYDVHPKSVVRDIYERSMGFAEYVAHYGLGRSEGLLLRYLSDAYKALTQNVPEDAKTPPLRDVTEWLGEMVRQVDSSLLDEWELLSDPELVQEALARGVRPGAGPPMARPGAGGPPLTANTRAFAVMVRNACFRRVELAAKRDWAALGQLDEDAGWDATRWRSAFDAYFGEHAGIGTGAAARGPLLWQVEESGRHWRVRQVLDDPTGDHDWAIVAGVDLDESDRRGEPGLRPLGVERL